MFKFVFSNNKIISRDTSSYPIDLDDVKAKSFYFTDNPADDTQDTYISNTLIPSVVFDWENTSKYYLLDQTIQSFIPNLSSINASNLELELEALNIRSVDSVRYHPIDWDESDAKETLDATSYIITDELENVPASFRMKSNDIPLDLFEITNNLQLEFQAGFLDNDFDDLNQEIKDALCMQAALIIDTKNGYCEDFYSNIIEEYYSKYSIKKQQISII